MKRFFLLLSIIALLLFGCSSPTDSGDGGNSNDDGDGDGTGGTQLTAAHCELSSTSWSVESQGTSPYQTFGLHFYGVVENTGETKAENVSLTFNVSGNCFTVNNTSGSNTSINGLSTKTIEGVTGWTNSAGIDGYNCAYGISNSDVSYTLTWN